MINKRLTSYLFLLATLTAFGVKVKAQTNQNVNVTIRPAQTVEERVADEFKEKRLRKEAEEKLAAEESARIAETGPKAILSQAKTVNVYSSTDFFDGVQLQNALQKGAEFESWHMAIVSDWNNKNFADITVVIDRPLFTYTFTYQITSRGKGVVLATGKVTAFDSIAAAPKLAERIIDDIKLARGESKPKK